MKDIYILHHEVGLRVAVRLPHSSLRGQIVVVRQNRVVVLMTDGSTRSFSRSSGLQIGSKGHKWIRPYLTTIAEAEDRDRAREAANERAKKRMADGSSPSWLTIKAGHLNGWA